MVRFLAGRCNAECHGHMRVPVTYKTPGDNYNLGTWASSRRAKYKRGALSQDRIAELEALKGWVWSVK